MVASGGSIADTTPTVQGTISAALSGGASVRVYRGATLVGSFSGAGTAWSVDDSDIGQGSRSYTARVENGTAYSATSGSYTVTVDTIAPAQTFGGITGSSTVMPNTTVSGATTPASGLISSGGSTNDNSPRLSFTLSAALASDEFLRVKRNGTTVSIVSQVSCGTNCFRLEVPATVTLTNNESGSLSLTAPATGGLPTAAQSYTVVVVDGAGNEGTASAAFSIAFNYFACDNVRANATYFAAFAVNHPSWTNLNCNSCHTTSTPGITPVAGTMIAVPSSTPTYWCRRP